jgi:hypothetical protein
LNNLVEAPQPPGEVDAQAMEQDFLARIGLGNAP